MTEVSSGAILPPGFTASNAHVNGVTIHYVRGGSGKPLVLIHGWPQTWYERRGLMPRLAERYTVVAVQGGDKPGQWSGGVVKHIGVDAP